MGNKVKELSSKKKEPSATPGFKIEAQPDVFRGVYSNLAVISHTENEFVIDFLMRITGNAQLVSRVILSPRHAKSLLSALAENIKKFETGTETTFKEIIIKAVHQAGFSYYKGIYRKLEDEIIFEVEGRKRKRYLIVAHYWSLDRGIYFPSEQIEKYFNRAKKSENPYIIVTNSSGLTQKAHEDLKEFNKEFEEPKLFIIFGSNESEFIKKFSDL